MTEKKASVVEQVADIVIGAVDYSAERLTKAVNALVERGKVSGDEASKIIREMSERGREDREKIRAKLESAFQKVRHVSQSEFEDLKKRVEALEKKLAGG